jgi:hypothetical protein
VQRSGSAGAARATANRAHVRKLAGIAFFLYCGFACFFVIMYGIGLTEFDLPIGPPIFAVVSVALACAAVTQLARRS